MTVQAQSHASHASPPESREPAPQSLGRTRRALLAGALGGVGAVVAGSIGAASRVRAEGESIAVGGEYTTATSRTRIRNQANNGEVFRAESAASGVAITGVSATDIGVRGESTESYGVFGTSVNGYGVRGESTNAHAIYGLSPTHNVVYGASVSGTGVRGSCNEGIGCYGESLDSSGIYGISDSQFGVYGVSQTSIGVRGGNYATNAPAIQGRSVGNSTGVLGYSGGGTIPAAQKKTGVYGAATQDANSRGVWGFSEEGRGVYGQSSSGVGVFGTSSGGFAIRGSGRVKLEKVSGVARIDTGSTSVTVHPDVNVTSGTFVLLTPKANLGSRGLWFSTNASANTFTIRISKARSSNTRISWLLLG